MRVAQPRPRSEHGAGAQEHEFAAPVDAKRRRRWRTDLKIFLGIVAVLAAARLAMAPLVERYVNRTLDRHADYAGRIGEVDINLWRGAYVVRDVELFKRDGESLEPYIAAKSPPRSMSPTTTVGMAACRARPMLT